MDSSSFGWQLNVRSEGGGQSCIVQYISVLENIYELVHLV